MINTRPDCKKGRENIGTEDIGHMIVFINRQLHVTLSLDNAHVNITIFQVILLLAFLSIFYELYKCTNVLSPLSPDNNKSRLLFISKQRLSEIQK